MSDKDGLPCWCDDLSRIKTDVCVVCSKLKETLMNHVTVKANCPKHKLVMFCGECDFVCQGCTDNGWISTSGTGGGSYILNHKTNEEIKNGVKKTM